MAKSDYAPEDVIIDNSNPDAPVSSASGPDSQTKAIFTSHTRSGLHLLRGSLAIIDLENNSDKSDYWSWWSNDKEWGNKYRYTHNCDDLLERSVRVPGAKLILLIRNYHDLMTRTFAPWILRTYASIDPQSFLRLGEHLDIERLSDETLSDVDRFGSFAFEYVQYCNLIKYFDHLHCQPGIDTKVIYFEDLINSYEETIIEVADFLELKYDIQNINFKEVKKQVKKLYEQTGHVPCPPELKYLTGITHESCEVVMLNQTNPELFEKYLKRYKGKYIKEEEIFLRRKIHKK